MELVGHLLHVWLLLRQQEHRPHFHLRLHPHLRDRLPSRSQEEKQICQHLIHPTCMLNRRLISLALPTLRDHQEMTTILPHKYQVSTTITATATILPPPHIPNLLLLPASVKTKRGKEIRPSCLKRWSTKRNNKKKKQNRLQLQTGLLWLPFHPLILPAYRLGIIITILSST